MGLAQRKPEQQIEIHGTVERVLFCNPENGYCVVSIRPHSARSDLDGNITAVGYIPGQIRDGSEYVLIGQWTMHPKYGQQFKFTEHRLEMPSSHQGIIRYFTDVAFGVGPKKAKRIIEALGADCLDKIKDDPAVLDELNFLNDYQKQQISEDLNKNTVLAELTSLICGEGVTPKLAAKIYNLFKDDSVNQVKDNPYILAEELWGVGFKVADRVARNVGIEEDSPHRVKACVKYVLRQAGNEGHVYLRPRDVDKQVKALCGAKVDTQKIKGACDELIESGVVIREGNAMYHKDLYGWEVSLANDVKRLLTAPSPLPLIDIRGFIDNNPWDIEFAPEQKEAIEKAINNRISIITGGPGVGKTTVIKAICDMYEEISTRTLILMASPTGRAAKRMEETTGREAKTIHRLLHYNPSEGGFQYNKDDQLPGPGLLIIDEFSMCDVELAAALFEAIPVNMQVVLVGDVDQLPSVGPGYVLGDLIASGKIPTTRLKYNYRQANGSMISAYANMTCEGLAPPQESEGDYEFAEIYEPEEGLVCIAQYIKQLQRNGLSTNIITDFQILAPMHKGKLGTKSLNELAKSLLNPPHEKKPECGQFRLGDKVMVTKNDYTLGVFNGDIGRVVSVCKGTVEVAISNGEQVKFEGEDLGLLQLAYAVTIHKSQGSEFPIVIMPLVRHHYIMLQRNLIYTGMTRARNKLVLVADPQAVKKAVHNNKVERRYSLLAERLQGENEVQEFHSVMQ